MIISGSLAVDTSLAFAVQMVAASRDSEDDAAMKTVPKPPQAYFFEVMEKVAQRRF